MHGDVSAEDRGSRKCERAGARFDQSAGLRAAVDIQHAAAVDGARDDRVACSIECQIADDRMQCAVYGQRFSACDVPRLRSADVDLRAECGIFAVRDAAGRHGQRPAVERVPGRVDRQAVSDDRAAHGDRSAGSAEGCGGFLIFPSISGPAGIVVPVGPAFRPSGAAAFPRSRRHCARVKDRRVDRDDVGMHFEVAVGNVLVAVVAGARSPTILDDPISAGRNARVVLIADQHHGVIDAACRRAVIRLQLRNRVVQIVRR